MADIIYTYKDSVYANITNKCNCRCTFCIRFVKDGVGDADTLWHQVNPSKKEVIDAIKNFDFTSSLIVFLILSPARTSVIPLEVAALSVLQNVLPVLLIVQVCVLSL